MYVPLWVKTNFSFLEGASHPEELVETAHRLGMPALAITDRDGVYGVVRAHEKAKELGLPLLLGTELSVLKRLPPPTKKPRTARTTAAPLEGTTRMLLFAETRAGYGAMCTLLSEARLRAEKGTAYSTLETICRAAPREVIAIALEPLQIAPLREAFGPQHLYVHCSRHRTADEHAKEITLRSEAKRCGVPVVVGNEVLYHSSSRRMLQDVLTCIRYGTTLTAAGRLLRPNAEHVLKPHDAMSELFADDVEGLARTREIAERCRFSLAEIRYRYPAERLPEGFGESDWLRELSYRGARTRYDGEIPPEVEEQIERELSIISDLDYGGYFLTMWEIVQYCREHGILCQGRGSAANSSVCYCLGITAVDPVRMDLLFERFLSRERAEPPDIDLDIEHERREEVIQHVYGRYGRKHAAMVANIIRYRTKSAVRDVGKALGLASTDLDHLSRFTSYRDALSADLFHRAGLDPGSPHLRHLLALSGAILDFPRHLSIHPGGFLLGHEPVDTLVPIEPATMEGRTVIQWDKYDVEALGLFKVDLLGLGSLTVVQKCFGLIRDMAEAAEPRPAAAIENSPPPEGPAPGGGPLIERFRGSGAITDSTLVTIDRPVLPHSTALLRRLDMARVPPECPATYEMCSQGDTIGVFQIESRAQMAMLPRLRPRTFYDLVIEVAIVRPGPIQGDMVHPYLRRRAGEEKVVLPHPKLERALMRTLGVPIFQEQVMKLAVLVADYSPGEADQLRRDMAAWKSSGRIDMHRERLLTRMVANGITPEFADRVFSQIQGFGEYGFPESHAASFALIAYVTAWMKCHYPAAFACALLNAQPMGFYAPSTIIEDMKRHGVEARPIDVNASEWDCTLEDLATTPGPSLRMGLRYIRGFGTREREAIAEARGHAKVGSPGAIFESVDDFARRTRLSTRALLALSEAGAFESLEVTRRDAIWQSRGTAAGADDSLTLPENAQPRFGEIDPHQAIAWDYSASGHSARGHPMEQLRAALEQRGIPDARTLVTARDGAWLDYVGMVICRQRPGTASGVVFYTLEDETGFVNVVCWSRVFDRYENIAKTASLLGIRGRIQAQHGVVHLVAEHLYVPDLRQSVVPASRDFH